MRCDAGEPKEAVSSSPMFGRANLELLKDAALGRDWKGANEAYLELVWVLAESSEQYDRS